MYSNPLSSLQHPLALLAMTWMKFCTDTHLISTARQEAKSKPTQRNEKFCTSGFKTSLSEYAHLAGWHINCFTAVDRGLLSAVILESSWQVSAAWLFWFCSSGAWTLCQSLSPQCSELWHCWVLFHMMPSDSTAPGVPCMMKL